MSGIPFSAAAWGRIIFRARVQEMRSGRLFDVDSGGAIVLGAAIALVGSIVGGAIVPWVREVQTRNVNNALARREAVDSAIRGVLLVAMDEFLVGNERDRRQRQQAAVRERTALFELDLLLTTDESDVHEAGLSAFSLLHRSTEERLRAKVISELSTSLPAWVRGEIPASHVLSRIEELDQVADPSSR